MRQWRVRLDRVWLTDVRSYATAELELAPGLTALLGDNGQGKTNVLEAIAWLATLSSFRGAPTEALIRRGAERAVIRAEGEREGRAILIEAELVASGRNRVLVNRQPLKRARDLLGVLRVTVFAPDDLELVKGGPGERRRYLDDALVASHPRYDALRGEVDKVLKQRNALLKGVGRSPRRRRRVHPRRVGRQARRVRRPPGRGPPGAPRAAGAGRWATTYDAVANRPAEVTAAYVADWSGVGLEAALGGQPHATTSGGACPPSARTATTSSCRSAACRPAPTPRRASSARWPSRCAWRRTT